MLCTEHGQHDKVSDSGF